MPAAPDLYTLFGRVIPDAGREEVPPAPEIDDESYLPQPIDAPPAQGAMAESITPEPRRPADDTLTALQHIAASMDRTERLLYLLLITQGGLVVTELGNLFTGDKIGAVDGYQALYQNKTQREIRIQIFVSVWGTPGEGIKLSLTSSLGDQGLIDTLVNAANGKSESIIVALKPEQTLYINTLNTNFSLTSGTQIRTRVFDPQNFLTR